MGDIQGPQQHRSLIQPALLTLCFSGDAPDDSLDPPVDFCPRPRCTKQAKIFLSEAAAAINVMTAEDGQ